MPRLFWNETTGCYEGSDIGAGLHIRITEAAHDAELRGVIHQTFRAHGFDPTSTTDPDPYEVDPSFADTLDDACAPIITTEYWLGKAG